jgi:hypothetical protein
MIIMRKMHVIRSYKVGSKTGKSIAVIIQHEIVKRYEIKPKCPVNTWYSYLFHNGTHTLFINSS